MCAEAEGAEAEGAKAEGADVKTEQVLPPEPYPGFYNDMRRAGMSEEQAIVQAQKAQNQANPSASKGSGKIGGKKSLLGPDGKPLAPWMNVEADYDRSIRKKKGDSAGRLAGDPQRQELSGVGLQSKMLGDELELTWATGSETGSFVDGVEYALKGFVVSRRKGQTEMWERVCDWRDKPAELLSKGPDGGAYSFIVTDPEPGAWIYRISDEDGSGKLSDLSQTLVDIESGEDSQTRLIALAVLLAVIFGFVAFSLITDPLSGTS